jgi:signal transduction histidine kinase
MTDIERVALAARVFTIAALTSLAVLSGGDSLLGALMVIVVASAAFALSRWAGASLAAVAALEGAVVAVLAVSTYPHGETVTPYLVIPALIGALALGRRGMAMVIAVEFGILVVLWAALEQRWDREMAASGLTWLATAIGLGFLGVSLRSAITSSESDASYRSAVSLIRRLDALSGKLTGGLDPVDIAEQALLEVEDVVPLRQAGVFVRTSEGGIAPLRLSSGSHADAVGWKSRMAETAWASAEPVIDNHQTALPMTVDQEVVGVAVLDAHRMIEQRQVDQLVHQLRPHALQLQAALLFARVWESATHQERQRIAREVHDGVAQDVASLGYLVDNIATGATDPAQRERVEGLRTELTRVVSELRHQIFDLRQVAPAAVGLGESLAAHARQVGSTSSLTVHVTLDESGGHLTRKQEHELLRIAQEAMNNARKHSRAENLWLRCVVQPAYAEVEVCDDGRQPHSPRADSQGLRIMQERADSIGAKLVIDPPTPDSPGTCVHVYLDSTSR